MNKVERVITALNGGVPDMVPFIFSDVMQNVQEGIVGHPITDPTYNGINASGWLGGPDDHPEVDPVVCCVPEAAQILNLDAINIQAKPPLFVNHVISQGEECISGGLINGSEMLNKCKAAMPDPDDEKLFRKMEEMIKEYRCDMAVGVYIRLGVSPVLLSCGIDNVAYFMADEDDTLERTIEMYTEWNHRFCKNLNELDFDYFWSFDDIAYTKSMMISPETFRKYFKEPLKHARKHITKPLIFHSDGNYSRIIDDILEIGASALHPIERESINSQWLVDNYKGKVAFIGNVDIDHILTDATEEEVYEDVRSRIELFGPGGGYLICESNSIASWCTPRNVIVMSKAVEKYRHIY